jgi:hypothetical protein
MNSTNDKFLEITRSCHCPIFFGCGFSVSNIPSERRTDLANLILAHGGRYMGQMDKNKCTHLIVSNAGGKKYQYAKKWGITIITEKWIRDSIEREFALSTDLPEYQIKSENQNDLTSDLTSSRLMIEETVNRTSNVQSCSESADFEQFLEKEIDVDDDLFQSSRFFVTGFSPRHSKMIQDIIRRGGGYIFDTLSPSITHLICSRINAESNRDVSVRNR